VTEATLPSPPGFEPRVAPFGARRVAYATAGTGSPVVLVHGLGGAASNWAELASHLAKRRRVLVVDLPGHGGSDPPAAAHSLDSYVDAVAACLEREAAGAAAVVGHSFGGAVALGLAMRRPELVSKLVLAAAAGISSTTIRARVGLRVLGTLRLSRVAARYRNEVARSARLRRLVFGALASDPAGLGPAAVHGFLRGSAAVSDSRTALHVLVRHDPRTALGGVACPVLVLWGARDRFLALDDGLEYARRLRAPLRVLPDTGHLLIAERPEECALLIERFLGPPSGSDGVREVDELPVEVESVGQQAG
jgi:pimeloyl-ACP methyl ester carboxylesterase